MKLDREILSFLFDDSPDAVFFDSADERVVYANDAALDLEGFTREKMEGRCFRELYDFKNDFKIGDSPLCRAFETKEHIKDQLITYFVNNRKIVSTCDAKPVFDGDEFMGVLVIERDLTAINSIVEQNFTLQKELLRMNEEIHTAQQQENHFDDLVGQNIAYVQCKQQAAIAAKTDSSVLIVGETGCGKEVFAKAIHKSSNRSDKPFYALNCAAIPESLIESILFGTSKGVYTGAIDREGLLSQANGGTLFLDELNSMPLMSQAKLLRVLEEKQITKLGSNKAIPLDIRVISAINEAPLDAMKNHHIRSDLYYRLSVVELSIPPLRKRMDDVSLLVSFFIDNINQKLQKNIIGIENEAIKIIKEYNWPGNVRQLKACIESAMNFAENNSRIQKENLPAYVFGEFENAVHSNAEETDNRRQKASADPIRVPHLQTIIKEEPPTPNSITPHEQLKKELEEKKGQEIMDALRQCDGSLTKTAEKLGISKQLLIYRMKKYHLR